MQNRDRGWDEPKPRDKCEDNAGDVHTPVSERFSKGNVDKEHLV